jgi:hypothetical protein
MPHVLESLVRNQRKSKRIHTFGKLYRVPNFLPFITPLIRGEKEARLIHGFPVSKASLIAVNPRTLIELER